MDVVMEKWMCETDRMTAPMAITIWDSNTLLPRDVKIKLPTIARQMISREGYTKDTRAQPLTVFRRSPASF